MGTLLERFHVLSVDIVFIGLLFLGMLSFICGILAASYVCVRCIMYLLGVHADFVRFSCHRVRLRK